MVKFLLAAAILGSAGGAGGGTIIAHLHHTKAKAPVVQIALATPGKKNALSVPGVAMAAGDRLQRPFDLSNKSTTPILGIALTASATLSSALDTDAVNGLQLRVDRCPGAWKNLKKTRQYACSRTIVPVVSPRPVIGANVPLSGLGDLNAKKGTAHLLLTLSLPASAPNSLQGKSSTLTYTFTATQAG